MDAATPIGVPTLTLVSYVSFSEKERPATEDGFSMDSNQQSARMMCFYGLLIHP